MPASRSQSNRLHQEVHTRSLQTAVQRYHVNGTSTLLGHTYPNSHRKQSPHRRVSQCSALFTKPGFCLNWRRPPAFRMALLYFSHGHHCISNEIFLFNTSSFNYELHKIRKVTYLFFCCQKHGALHKFACHPCTGTRLISLLFQF